MRGEVAEGIERDVSASQRLKVYCPQAWGGGRIQGTYGVYTRYSYEDPRVKGPYWGIMVSTSEALCRGGQGCSQQSQPVYGLQSKRLEGVYVGDYRGEHIEVIKGDAPSFAYSSYHTPTTVSTYNRLHPQGEQLAASMFLSLENSSKVYPLPL